MELILTTFKNNLATKNNDGLVDVCEMIEQELLEEE